jgi:SAM-dependent methyltransferase
MRYHADGEYRMRSDDAGINGIYDAFLAPKATLDRLHDYRLRRDILRSITDQLPNFFGTFLDVGCGRMPYKSLILSPPSQVKRYVGADVEGNPHGHPDLIFDGQHIPLEDASVDSAMATEVLEHCTEAKQLLHEIIRVLKPGGLFLFTVPFIWPLHEVPHDHYRYTPFALKRLFNQVGFIKLQLKGHGGWDASLAQMVGLWVTYRGMRPYKRKILALVLRPIIQFLNRHDVLPEPCDAEASMFTGLSGTARKPFNT